MHVFLSAETFLLLHNVQISAESASKVLDWGQPLYIYHLILFCVESHLLFSLIHGIFRGFIYLKKKS